MAVLEWAEAQALALSRHYGIGLPIPSTSDNEKPALLDEIKSTADSQALFVLIGVILTPIGVAIAAPLGASAALVATPIYFLQRQRNAAKRRLDDPPREDFTTGVRAKPRRFHPELVGNTAAERAVSEWGVRSLRYTAYLEAVVRADERAQQAAIERDFITADKRLAEGARAANQASQEASLTAVAARRASDQLTEIVPGDRIRGGRGYIDQLSQPIDLLQDLPEELINEATRAGLAIGDLEPSFEADPEILSRFTADPELELATVINRYSDATEQAGARTAEDYQPSDIRKRLGS